jgi:hypothetical protein
MNIPSYGMHEPYDEVENKREAAMLQSEEVF